MGLVTGAFMQAKLFSPEMDIDDFILLMDTNKSKRTSNQHIQKFFSYAYAK